MTTSIGLLVCGHVPPELRGAASGRDYPEMYTDLLTGAEPDLSISIFDAEAGVLPDDPADCAGWVITGSRHDAFGAEAWLADLHGFIRRLDGAGSRTVGVCFGHQAIAHALGGRVERAGGWKVGPQALAADSTAWFAAGQVTIHAMHRDEVTQLPPGARAIGRGDTARYPLYLCGEHMLGIQDHPEFDDVYEAALVEARRKRIGVTDADKALALIGTVPTDRHLVARWLVDFLLDRRL